MDLPDHSGWAARVPERVRLFWERSGILPQQLVHTGYGGRDYFLAQRRIGLAANGRKRPSRLFVAFTGLGMALMFPTIARSETGSRPMPGRTSISSGAAQATISSGSCGRAVTSGIRISSDSLGGRYVPARMIRSDRQFGCCCPRCCIRPPAAQFLPGRGRKPLRVRWSKGKWRRATACLCCRAVDGLRPARSDRHFAAALLPSRPLACRAPFPVDLMARVHRQVGRVRSTAA